MLAASVLRATRKAAISHGCASHARTAAPVLFGLASPARIIIRPPATAECIRALHPTASAAQAAVPATDSAPSTTLVGALLDDAVAKYKIRNCLKAATGPADDYIKWTFEELLLHSNAVAVGLLHAGFKPGDRLVVMVRPSAELLTTQIGCAKVGVSIVVPAKPEELEAVMKLYKPRGVLMDPQYQSVETMPLIEKIIPELENYVFSDGLPLATKKFPTLRRIWHTGSDATLGGRERFRDMLLYNNEAHSLSKVAAQVSENAPLVVELSSPSAGVVLTERGAVSGGARLSASAKLAADDRVTFTAASLPVTSLFLSSAATLTSGSQLVLSKVYCDAAASQSVERGTVVLGDAKSLTSKPGEGRPVDISAEVKQLKSGTINVDAAGKISL